MTVIQFPTGEHKTVGVIAGTPISATRQPYHIHVVPDANGFEWWVCAEDPDAESEPDEDDIATDLASIALMLRPVPRTFLEWLKALILGDPND